MTMSGKNSHLFIYLKFFKTITVLKIQIITNIHLYVKNW